MTPLAMPVEGTVTFGLGEGAGFASLPAIEKATAARSLPPNHHTGTSCIPSSLAALTDQPFVFPSLGPTAFLLFYAAMGTQSAPRNVFCGHLLGVLAGYLALVLFGLTGVGPNLEDVTWPRVGAVTVALCLTLSLMVWLKVPHAPAGATTLIVALGLMRTPGQLFVLMVAVVLMILQGLAINRLAGLPYPLWAPQPTPDHGPASNHSG